MDTCAWMRENLLSGIKRNEAFLGDCKKLAKLHQEMAELAPDKRARANHSVAAKFFATEAPEIYRTEIQVKEMNLEMVSEAARKGCQEIEELSNG